MMIRGIADTHALIWYIYNDSRLSPTAKSFFEEAAAAGMLVGVSTISLAEIVYLIEKGRILKETLNRVQVALDMADSVLITVPFDRLMAEAMTQVNRSQVADLPDRIIAATALHLGVPLLSKDAKIKASGIPTIW